MYFIIFAMVINLLLTTKKKKKDEKRIGKFRMNYFRNSRSYQFMHLDLQCIHLEDARKRPSKSWNMLSQFSERRLGMI